MIHWIHARQAQPHADEDQHRSVPGRLSLRRARGRPDLVQVDLPVRSDDDAEIRLRAVVDQLLDRARRRARAEPLADLLAEALALARHPVHGKGTRRARVVHEPRQDAHVLGVVRVQLLCSLRVARVQQPRKLRARRPPPLPPEGGVHERVGEQALPCAQHATPPGVRRQPAPAGDPLRHGRRACPQARHAHPLAQTTRTRRGGRSDGRRLLRDGPGARAECRADRGDRLRAREAQPRQADVRHPARGCETGRRRVVF